MLSSRTLSRPAPWLLFCLAVPTVLALISVNYWHDFPSPNERARAYQALAVVTRGSLAIGEELRRFGTMEDVASHAGEVYPNKAPGLLPLLLPAASVATLSSEPATRLKLTLVLGRLLAASLPLLLTITLLAELVAERWPRGGPAVVVIWALASPALTASLLLFAHSLTALLVLVGYALLFEARISGRNGLLAGAVLAWAFACEYQIAVPVAVLVLLATPRWRSRIALVAAGAGPPLALLGAYNWICFSSPFTLSSAHEANQAFAQLASRGLFGISLPSLDGLTGMLLSPSRGLLLFAPFAALAALGWGSRQEPGRRTARTALVLAPVALLVLMSGYPNWHGGMFPGPRYLLGVLPLLVVAAASGAEVLVTHRWGTAVVGLVFLWSLIAIWPITATFPFPPPTEPFPSLILAPDLAGWGAWFPSWLPTSVAIVLWGLGACGAIAALASVVPGRGALATGGLAAIALATLAATTPAPHEWSAESPAPLSTTSSSAPPQAHSRSCGLACSSPAECAQVDGWILRRRALQRAR